MAQKSILLFSIFLLALSRQGCGQDGWGTRYVVDIIEVLSRNTSVRSTRCFGTVITQRHILTSAECATSGPESYLGYAIRGILEPACK